MMFEEHLGVRRPRHSHQRQADQRQLCARPRRLARLSARAPCRRPAIRWISPSSDEGFLTVQTPDGERYTRNGAMQIAANGQLVNR